MGSYTAAKAGSRGGLGAVTLMREFANQKALQDHVNLHDLVYLWEGTRPFAASLAALAVVGASRGS
jgi:hypothetical protein